MSFAYDLGLYIGSIKCAQNLSDQERANLATNISQTAGTRQTGNLPEGQLSTGVAKHIKAKYETKKPKPGLGLSKRKKELSKLGQQLGAVKTPSVVHGTASGKLSPGLVEHLKGKKSIGGFASVTQPGQKGPRFTALSTVNPIQKPTGTWQAWKNLFVQPVVDWAKGSALKEAQNLGALAGAMRSGASSPSEIKGILSKKLGRLRSDVGGGPMEASTVETRLGKTEAPALSEQTRKARSFLPGAEGPGVSAAGTPSSRDDFQRMYMPGVSAPGAGTGNIAGGVEGLPTPGSVLKMSETKRAYRGNNIPGSLAATQGPAVASGPSVGTGTGPAPGGAGPGMSQTYSGGATSAPGLSNLQHGWHQARQRANARTMGMLTGMGFTPETMAPTNGPVPRFQEFEQQQLGLA
jgi:hypothetical protein